MATKGTPKIPTSVKDGVKEVGKHIAAATVLGVGAESVGKISGIFDLFKKATDTVKEKDPEIVSEATGMIQKLSDTERNQLLSWCNTPLHFKKLGAKWKGEKNETDGSIVSKRRKFIEFLRFLANLDPKTGKKLLLDGVPVDGDKLRAFNKACAKKSANLRKSAKAQEKPARWWR